jgi:hypothetical protein
MIYDMPDIPEFLDRREKRPGVATLGAVPIDIPAVEPLIEELEALANGETPKPKRKRQSAKEPVTIELTAEPAAPPTPEVRPLDTLAQLIHKQIRLGQDAAERAAAPHWLEVGKLLHEAKAQLAHGEFGDWCKRHFKISTTQRARYMRAAESAVQNFRNGKFDSLEDHLKGSSYANTPRERSAVDCEALRQEALQGVEERARERDLRRKLMLKLIDRGYKVLAAELHPDKGGSTEAMTRLNEVRDAAKRYAASTGVLS